MGCCKKEEVENLSAGINAFEGGFLVELNGRVIITTSLNKAIKLVREHLTEEGEVNE